MIRNQLREFHFGGGWGMGKELVVNGGRGSRAAVSGHGLGWSGSRVVRCLWEDYSNEGSVSLKRVWCTVLTFLNETVVPLKGFSTREKIGMFQFSLQG